MTPSTPFLTEYDPDITGEGSLWPLGLYTIADRLATKLVPGLRERMFHPRFLTAMAVGSVICSEFDSDEIAVDGVSEPWMVYEWYVVQALFKTFFNKDPDQIKGLPGRNKAASAFYDNVPLSATRYLKTAYVFGFHGVYRTLALEIELIDSYNNLGEFGNELIRVWEKEQGLDGFYTSTKGKGREFRNKLIKAIQEGMKKGVVAKTWYWEFYETIAQHLAPYLGGHKELNLIYEALTSQNSPLRREVLFSLISEDGASTWLENRSEKAFHQHLKQNASSEVKQLLDTIEAYEWFSRLIYDAFTDCLYRMSIQEKTSLEFLAESKAVKRGMEEIPQIFDHVIHALERYDEAGEFILQFSPLIQTRDGVSWVNALVELHENVQKNKPPHGKRPWFERIGNDQLVVYSDYNIEKEPVLKDSYVHYFRTNSLWSFMVDLKKVTNE